MNINNQTEYKKPLGSRLFILITVCIIVVAMAVPAFAYSSYDFEYVDDTIRIWGDNGQIYISKPDGTDEVDIDFYYVSDGPVLITKTSAYYIAVLSEPLADSVSYVATFRATPGGSAGAQDIAFVSPSDGALIDVSGYTATIQTDLSFNILGASAFRLPVYTYGIDAVKFATFPIYASYDSDVVIRPADVEPPPDFGEEVTGVLPTVLSWIQQTLNALFVEGGALQGLLLLVAVPVAITLVFLGARFIRSFIWGA